MAASIASQAKLNALLRNSPQRTALRELAENAQAQYQSQIAAGTSTGRETLAAVQAAQPQVKGVYDRAQATTTAQQSAVAQALAGLHGVDGFQAAAATEGAAGQGKLARERAAEESDLQSQQVAAKEAPAFARTLASQQLATQLSKIFSSTQSLAGQEGADAAAEAGKLENEAEGRRVTERGQNLSARSQSESRTQKAHEHEEDIAAKNGTNGNIRLLPQSAQTKAASTVRQIEGEARALREHGAAPQQVFKELTSTHPAYNVIKETEGTNGQFEKLTTPQKGGRLNDAGQPVKKGETGTREYEYEKSPALAAHDSLLSQAAIESVYGSGAVTKKTLARLHSAGYSVKALELAVRNEGAGPRKVAVTTGPKRRPA